MIPTVADYRARPAHPARITGGKHAAGEIRRDLGLVTAITVSFNSARTIDRTITSVAAQNYSAVEYLVIDGGSVDGTVDHLRRSANVIDQWISEPDEGISDAFNKGIALAAGEFVAIVNADDWWEPEHLAIGVAELRGSTVDFTFGDLILHALDGEQVHRFVGERDYERRIAHVMPFINHPTVICRRTAFDKIGLFDPSLHIAMDYDWFLRGHSAGLRGAYTSRLVTHMTLDGKSDRHFQLALKEVREISVRHGYPRPLAWLRYLFRRAKGRSRRVLHRWLPSAVYEWLRRRINASYRSNDSPTV